MKLSFERIAMVVCLLALGAFVMHSQAPPEKHAPSRHRVAIYHVAPGKHLQFLKWMAEREAVAKEAGAPPTHWFMHTDGASWDYIAIDHVGDLAQQAEQDKKTDALAKKKGLATGTAALLEFRQFISSHSDTYALGPMTAEEIVKDAEKRD